MARKTLADWIHGVMTDPQFVGEGKPGLTSLSLVHKVGSSDQEVYTYMLGNGETSSPASYAEAFEEKANTRVQDVPGVHTFNVLCFYGVNQPAGRFVFVRNVEPPQDGNATEPATPQGRVQQMMRREEMLFQSLFSQQQFMFQFMQGSMRGLAEENQVLRGENANMFAAAKQILMDQALVNREHEMKVIEAKRNAALVGKLLDFAPALANTVAGREVFPQAKADSATLDLICENLKPEQVDMLDALFPAELAAVLKQRVLSYMQKKEAEERRFAALYPEGSDPEAEARASRNWLPSTGASDESLFALPCHRRSARFARVDGPPSRHARRDCQGSGAMRARVAQQKAHSQLRRTNLFRVAEPRPRRRGLPSLRTTSKRRNTRISLRRRD